MSISKCVCNLFLPAPLTLFHAVSFTDKLSVTRQCCIRPVIVFLLSPKS